PPFSAVAVPPLEQLKRRPRDPGITLGPPLVQPLADEVHQVKLDRNTRDLPLRILRLGVAVEIDCPSPPLHSRWGFALDDVPVLGRRVEGGIQDRLWNFVSAHGARLSNDSDMARISCYFGRLFTTSNSFPRSSITFTAICPCSPGSNGVLVVPARSSQTASS